MTARRNTKLFVNRGERSGIDRGGPALGPARGRRRPRRGRPRVRVLERFSFVELKSDQAERAVEFLDGTKLHGKEIRLEVAKK